MELFACFLYVFVGGDFLKIFQMEQIHNCLLLTRKGFHWWKGLNREVWAWEESQTGMKQKSG